ncbi:hypothetical protein [Methylomagnum ishizawai]|uniref:hypothetical protein n=1 Tax=Methylomagnum ishizawai TaxID=1760988 RepID=UPI001C337EE6|nr:hypothetical protein [Methylomagnum ishizawai]BBL76415.1 hypothetical protein MishRS11D_35130 [Methylomagnum ishizawai]
MAFLNEYVSKEDIKKYALDRKWLDRHPEYKSLPSEFNAMWTIDRERDIYFQRTGGANQAYVNESWIEFHLNWDGKLFICRLEHGEGGSKKYNESPYIIVWRLISIDPSDLHGKLYEDVILVLKEALNVFGDNGVNSFVKNAIVRFSF